MTHDLCLRVENEKQGAREEKERKGREVRKAGKGKRRTAFNPPGGLVLAQLQLGSLHLEGSHEYPAAAALDVAPLIDPSSCANASSGKREKRRERGSMVGFFRVVRFKREVEKRQEPGSKAGVKWLDRC